MYSLLLLFVRPSVHLSVRLLDPNYGGIPAHVVRRGGNTHNNNNNHGINGGGGAVFPPFTPSRPTRKVPLPLLKTYYCCCCPHDRVVRSGCCWLIHPCLRRLPFTSMYSLGLYLVPKPIAIYHPAPRSLQLHLLPQLQIR